MTFLRMATKPAETPLCATCFERYSPQVRHEAETLMYRVADHVQSLESELLQPLVEALKSLLDSTGEFKLSDAAEAMREATKSLQESADYNQSLLLRGTRSAVQKSAGVASWISMGLLKRLTKEDDLKQRDALLDGLRQAKQAWPEATIVRYAVALGLRYALVLGLVIAVKNAKAENDLARRDALMEELRQLHRAYPEDAAVREQLAKGLVNTQVDAKAENDLARRDALMEDLRQLHRAYPEDAAVRERLAKGLFNARIAAEAENDLGRRDALMEELRQLHRAYPEDAAVREQLAKGLFNTQIDAKAENDLGRRDALMEELRQLHRAYPEDAAVRERLAKGLFNTQIDAKAENDLGRRDALMEEFANCTGLTLRTLRSASNHRMASQHPD